MSLEVVLLSIVLMSFVTIAAIMAINRNSVAAVERMANALQAAHQLYAQDVRTLMEQVLLLKGMHPHYAAPDKFTPAGHSWKVYDEMQRATPAEAPDMGSDDVAYERELQEDMREWQELQRQADLAQHVTSALGRHAAVPSTERPVGPGSD